MGPRAAGTGAQAPGCTGWVRGYGLQDWPIACARKRVQRRISVCAVAVHACPAHVPTAPPPPPHTHTQELCVRGMGYTSDQNRHYLHPAAVPEDTWVSGCAHCWPHTAMCGKQALQCAKTFSYAVATWGKFRGPPFACAPPAPVIMRAAPLSSYMGRTTGTLL